MRPKKFFLCPLCGNHSVYIKAGRIAGEDGYTCRTRDCEFFAYTAGDYQDDIDNRTKLRDLNPEGSEFYGRVYARQYDYMDEDRD